MSNYERPQRKFEVWLRSVPGPFAQYDGKVDVWAEDSEEAVEAAFLKLKRGAFPERSRGSWKVEKVILLGEDPAPSSDDWTKQRGGRRYD